LSPWVVEEEFDWPGDEPCSSDRQPHDDGSFPDPLAWLPWSVSD
jgi:hypothetical protein